MGMPSREHVALHVAQPAPCLLSPQEFSMKHAAPVVNIVKAEREQSTSSPPAYSEEPSPVFVHICLCLLPFPGEPKPPQSLASVLCEQIYVSQSVQKDQQSAANLVCN